MQDQTERVDAAREAFGLVAALSGNGKRHPGGNVGGREMTIAPGEAHRIRLTGANFIMFLFSFRRSSAVLLMVLAPLVSMKAQAVADDSPRRELRFWQRAVLTPQETTLNGEREKAGELSFVPVIVYLKVVVELEKAGSTSKGETIWNAIFQKADFSLNDYKAPLFLPWYSPDQKKAVALATGIRRVVAHLRGGTIEVKQGSDGQVVFSKDVNFGSTLKRALALISPENRKVVQSGITRILDSRQWQMTLSPQTPRFSPGRRLGDQWSYMPAPFLWDLEKPNHKTLDGSSQIPSIERQNEQVAIASFAKVNLSRVSFSGGYNYLSALTSRTKFDTQSLWPLEHSVTENGFFSRSTYVSTIPSKFAVQTHMITRPLPEK